MEDFLAQLEIPIRGSFLMGKGTGRENTSGAMGTGMRADGIITNLTDTGHFITPKAKNFA